MDQTNYWEEQNSVLSNSVKFEGQFGGDSEDEEYLKYLHGSKKKLARDPQSHRIIEKRRRDRMNSCLADLARLIPNDYMKKGRGRVEKTEIIEMAIRRIKHLMAHTTCSEAECHQDATDSPQQNRTTPVPPPQTTDPLADTFRLGFAECLNETIHFLMTAEGLSSDPVCSSLRSHLTHHCDNILQNESLRSRLSGSNSSSSGDEKPIVQRHQSEDESTTLICSKTEPTYDSGHNRGDNPEQANGHMRGSSCGSSSSTVNLLESDGSSGLSNNLSPTSWSSEKGDESNYKFKNRIQKRFERGGTDSAPSTILTPHITHTSTELLHFRRQSAPHSPIEPSTLVPIFALAPSGCHYFASWIEAGAIPSYISSASIHDGSSSHSKWLSSHSVTISVDFGFSRR